MYSVSHDLTYHFGGKLRAGTEKETDISMTAIEEAVSLLIILEQCFSTFVRSRPGKFFFRQGPGPKHLLVSTFPIFLFHTLS